MATVDQFVLEFLVKNQQAKAAAAQTKKDMKEMSEEAKKRAEEAEKAFKRWEQGIKMVHGALGGLMALAGATGLTQLISQVYQMEAALGYLSRQTGQSTQDLQAWGNVAELVGGKAEEMQAGMASLQKQMVEFKYKGEFSPTLLFFEQMGVSIRDTNGQMRSQNDIMLDLATRAKNLSETDFANLASSAGLNDAQIKAVMSGRQELEKLLKAQEANALVSKEQAEQAQKLLGQWAATKQELGALARRFVSDITPAVVQFLDIVSGVFNFLSQHRGFIYGFFTVLAAAMAPAIFAAGMLALEVLAITWPLLLVGAIIGALIDDFLTWKDGGTSLFGGLYDWISKINAAFDRMLKRVGIDNGLLGAFMKFTPVGMIFLSLLATFNKLKDVWSNWATGGSGLDWFYEFLRRGEEGFDKLVKKLSKFGDLFSAVMTGDWGKVKDIVKSMVVDVGNAIMGVDAPAKPMRTVSPAAAPGKGVQQPALAAKIKTPTNADDLAKFAQGADMPVGARVLASLVGLAGKGKAAADDTISMGRSGRYGFSFGSKIDGYIKEASKKYGIPEDVLRGFVHMEDGYTGKMSHTGALGVGQMTQRTWNSLADTDKGKAIGMTKITSANFRKANDPRRNDYINTMATGILAQENTAALAAYGLPATGENLYMAHNIGPKQFAQALQGKASKKAMDDMRSNFMRKNESPKEFAERQKRNYQKSYRIANSPAANNIGFSYPAGAVNQAELSAGFNAPRNNTTNVETTIGTINITARDSSVQSIASGIGGTLVSTLAQDISSFDTGMT